jgi:maltose alpha-D-glucosyltransferase / alpha-amylase
MIRSLDYAALSALQTGAVRPSDVERLEPWARAWSTWMSAAFLQSYLAALRKTSPGKAALGETRLVPDNDADTAALIALYLLDKCLYELDYEFNNRPDWVSIPLFGLVGLLDQDRGSADRDGIARSAS